MTLGRSRHNLQLGAKPKSSLDQQALANLPVLLNAYYCVSLKCSVYYTAVTNTLVQNKIREILRGLESHSKEFIVLRI